MKNTKFRFIYGQGPFFIYTGFRWPLLWWLWLVYWVMSIFFRFILLSLSRGCLAHPVGTHSPRLYFYREPISHLCVGGEPPLVPRRFRLPFNLFSFGEPLLVPKWCDTPNITFQARRPIGAGLCFHASQIYTTAVGVYGGNPTNRSLWCQWVESNHRPSAYEADVLTIWTTRAYVRALCVGRSPCGISLTLAQVLGA